jgi:hypothetical protein
MERGRLVKMLLGCYGSFLLFVSFFSPENRNKLMGQELVEVCQGKRRCEMVLQDNEVKK